MVRLPKLKKRKDNRYARTLTVNGNRKFVYGKTQDEADQKLDALKRKVKKGIAVDDNTTFGELAVIWYDVYIVNSKKSTKTKEMYRDTINAHISKFAKYKPDEILPIMIDKYLNSLGKSASLAHKIRITFNQIFKTAKRNKLIEDNPIDYVNPVKQDTPKRKFLEDDERNIVLDALKSDKRAYAFVIFLLHTGIRMNESVILLKNDLNKLRSNVDISKAAEFNGMKTGIKDPKSEAGNRIIPISAEVIDMVLEVNTDSIYVFPRLDGSIHSQYSIDSFWRRIQRMVKRHIIKLNKELEEKESEKRVEMIKPTFRMMRHTYATALYDAGVDVKYAQYLLGHADVKITLDIYTHISKFRHQENIPKVLNLYKEKIL